MQIFNRLDHCMLYYMVFFALHIVFCSIMISWFLLGRVPGVVSLLFFLFSRRKGILFHHDSFRVPARVPVLVFLFLSPAFSEERGRQWIFNYTCLWWKHGLLLFGVYAGVIISHFSLWHSTIQYYIAWNNIKYKAINGSLLRVQR